MITLLNRHFKVCVMSKSKLWPSSQVFRAFVKLHRNLRWGVSVKLSHILTSDFWKYLVFQLLWLSGVSRGPLETTKSPKEQSLKNGTCALHWKMFLNIDTSVFSRFTSHICWERIVSLKLMSSLILLHTQNRLKRSPPLQCGWSLQD